MGQLGTTNITPGDMASIASLINARLRDRERKLTPRAGSTQELNGNVANGVIQDGHAYAFDELLGASRPSAPQLIPFSWPGLVSPGDPSGPHLVVLPNVVKIYMITLAISVPDPDAEITVAFLLNGTEFDSLTLTTDETSTVKRYDTSWPALGGNETDAIQVQCTASGTVGSDLVANVRIV
jgi:hypothetical protein